MKIWRDQFNLNVRFDKFREKSVTEKLIICGYMHTFSNDIPLAVVALSLLNAALWLSCVGGYTFFLVVVRHHRLTNYVVTGCLINSQPYTKIKIQCLLVFDYCFFI